jgi:hypothetical protein
MRQVDRGLRISTMPFLCPPASAMSFPLPVRCSVDALALPKLNDS